MTQTELRGRDPMDEQQGDLQPGQVISPRSATDPSVPSPTPPQPERPPVAPEPDATPVPSPSPAPEDTHTTPSATPEPFAAVSAEWAYHGEKEPAPSEASVPDAQLAWNASEFVEHQKGGSWYVLLSLGGIGIAALVYLITHDFVSTVVVVAAVAALAAYGAHKPRVQQYGLDAYGIHVGQKIYRYEDFKTFSLTQEGSTASVIFMPLKRFMPPLTIYLVPEVEERVLGFLSSFLPFEQHRADAMDSLLRRIRF